MRRVAILGSSLLALAACSNSHDTTSTTKTTVLVASSAIPAPQAPIPVQYTCDGSQTSLPLQWSVPAGVRVDTWTLRIFDPDAPNGGFVHWVVENIPGATAAVAEGHEPPGDVRTAYRGPCPPKGSQPHHYVITVSGFRRGASVATGQLVGTYHRN